MLTFLHDSPTAATGTDSDERRFLVILGGRIASLRKARCVTQTQLVEALGVPQQQFVARMIEMALAQATTR